MAGAATPFKTKAIAGAWSAAGAIGSIVAYRNLRDYERKNPSARLACQQISASGIAQQQLGRSDLSIAWLSRSGRVDHFSGKASACFKLVGASGDIQVLATAHRRPPEGGDLDDDDEEIEGRGWNYYWRKPWELKIFFADKFAGLRGKVAGRGGEAEAEGKDGLDWDLDSLSLVHMSDGGRVEVLLGDPRGIPEFETHCVRRDAAAKSDSSRQRLHRVLGIVVAGAALAGGIRLMRSIQVSRSFGYARRSILAHPTVVGVIGPRANVQTSSGTYSRKYIDARLRLISDAGTVADVDLVATRDGDVNRPWRIALARMRSHGRNYELDKSLF